METAVEKYLSTHIDDRIERRRTKGAKDTGDIAALRVHGQRIVVEVKNTVKMNIGPHLNEAETERINDNALAAFVVQKRIGIGITQMDKIGEQLVAMTLRDLVALITGTRPDDTPEPEPAPEF